MVCEMKRAGEGEQLENAPLRPEGLDRDRVPARGRLELGPEGRVSPLYSRGERRERRRQGHVLNRDERESGQDPRPSLGKSDGTLLEKTDRPMSAVQEKERGRERR